MNMEIKAIFEMAGTTENLCFDPVNCSVLVSVEIGPEFEDGANRFDLNVLTHEYLRLIRGNLWGRALLIIDRFEWTEVSKIIEDLVAGISVNTWEDGVKILSLYMDWEYAGAANSTGKILVPSRPV